MPILNDLKNELERCNNAIASCETKINDAKLVIDTANKELSYWTDMCAMLERLIESAEADNVPNTQSVASKSRSRVKKPKSEPIMTIEPEFGAETDKYESAVICLRDLAEKHDVSSTVIASISNELGFKPVNKNGKYMVTQEQAESIASKISRDRR